MFIPYGIFIGIDPYPNCPIKHPLVDPVINHGWNGATRARASLKTVLGTPGWACYGHPWYHMDMNMVEHEHSYIIIYIYCPAI